MSKLDRKARRRKWAKAASAESHYNSRLIEVSRIVGTLIKGLAPNGDVGKAPALVQALTEYAKLLEPWATSVASFMLADVARRDASMWRQNGKEMSRALSRELNNAPTGEILRQLQAEQVSLIKSIPLEAAKRVHELSVEGITTSMRAKEVAREILRTTDVAESRARLIARTEVNRATSNLVQARSTWAGSDGYIWRTSGDSDVRDSHREMEGKYVRWSEPPTLDKLKGHAGALPNCRCFAEPVFPND